MTDGAKMGSLIHVGDIEACHFNTTADQGGNVVEDFYALLVNFSF